MRKRTQAREYALQILYQLDLTIGDLSQTFQDFWNDYPASPEICEFTERLVSGVIEHRTAIDEVIARYTENWDMSRMAVVDRNILRFAAFELLYADDIPPKVTINEAVNVAKKYSQPESGKFVNGVLDKISHSEPKRVGN
ncbi:MAG: transcription antitermination factor NusB [Candidatus Omnitrophica bacterium]|nr:transcription antitermination factor NusB [Candidatus Omnitrophota bacterium]